MKKIKKSKLTPEEAEIREMQKIIDKNFPKELQRQKRAYKHEMKIRKAFGKMETGPRKKT